MERKPIARIRSPWTPVKTPLDEFAGIPVAWYKRQTGDGSLLTCVAEEPLGWHLSISFRNHADENSRYPTWDEIAHARDELLPSDLDFVMFLPKAGEYVALHDTTFHLHEHPERNPDA